MTDPDPIYLAAARAWCLAKFPYDHEGQEQREQHLAYDAASTADERWLRAVVDTARSAERDRILDALALQHTNLVRRAIGETEIRELGPLSDGPPAVCACVHYAVREAERCLLDGRGIESMVIQPGNTLVLRLGDGVNEADIDRLSDQFRRSLPGVAIVAVQGVEQFAVYRPPTISEEPVATSERMSDLAGLPVSVRKFLYSKSIATAPCKGCGGALLYNLASDFMAHEDPVADATCADRWPVVQEFPTRPSSPRRAP